MVTQRHFRVLESFTRLLGVGFVVVRLSVARSSPVYGIPAVVIGLLFALRPYVGAELLELAATLF